MPVESYADRAAFFDGEEFAVQVQTDRGCFSANFDNEFSAVNFDTAHVGSRAPQLECATCDVEEHELNVEGARLTVINQDGSRKDYVVREHQPDGTGLTRLILGED